MKGKRSGKTNFVEMEKLVSRLRLVAKDTHVAQRMMRVRNAKVNRMLRKCCLTNHRTEVSWILSQERDQISFLSSDNERKKKALSSPAKIQWERERQSIFKSSTVHKSTFCVKILLCSTLPLIRFIALTTKFCCTL